MVYHLHPTRLFPPYLNTPALFLPLEGGVADAKDGDGYLKVVLGVGGKGSG